MNTNLVRSDRSPRDNGGFFIDRPQGPLVPRETLQRFKNKGARDRSGGSPGRKGMFQNQKIGH